MYRVLVADDEAIERQTICFLLRRCHFPIEISEADNGKNALKLLEATRYELLITDVRMPFVDGMELAERALELWPEIRVVFISGYDDFSYAKRALQLRALNYILKPIDEDEFTETVDKALADVAEQSVKESGVCDMEEDDSAENAQSMKHVIKMVTSYVKSHLNEKLSIEHLAKEVYLSPHYLSEVFIRENGYGLNRYIREQRMKRAQELLMSTNLRIGEIGYMVGYSNPSYFCKCFADAYHMTPEEYRNCSRR